MPGAKPLVCRFCRTFVVEPAETRNGLVYGRDEHTMLETLRHHVRGIHPKQWREVQRVLSRSQVWVDGPARLRWSDK